MNPLLLIAGIALLALTAADFAYTTISANKTGPLTRRTAAAFWKLIDLLAATSRWNALRRVAGPVVMSGVAMVWVAMTMLGWLLIFRADPTALEMKSSGDPAGWWESLAFVGSALSTVGASNARPASALWDNLSMVTAINGMVVLTLSVTFVLNITQTVATGRGFSALIRVRDPADAENDDLLLPALADLCVRLNASPLALYYSSARPERSVPESLRWLAGRVANSPDDRFRQYRYVLLQLPYLTIATENEDDPDQFLDAMDRWTRRFRLARQ